MKDVRKMFKYHISWTSVQCEQSCSMRTDGQTDRQTDMTKPIVAFRNFGNAPKNYNNNSCFVWVFRYFALTEERKSRTFENMALRRTSGPHRLTQESEYLYNEELHDLSSPPNKVRQTKDDKMGGTSKFIGKRKDIRKCWTTILKSRPMLGK